MAKDLSDEIGRFPQSRRTIDFEMNDTVHLRQAREHLTDISKCGCFSDGSMDPQHRESVRLALRYLNTVLYSIGSDED